MSKVKSIGKLVFGASLLATSVTFGLAQTPKETPTQDINDKARNFGKEVKEVYKKWINNDVAYIITKDEKKAFFVNSPSTRGAWSARLWAFFRFFAALN